MISVIRTENEGSILPGKLHQPPQHKVVELVASRHHVPIDFKLLPANVGHARRVILHEAVAEVIDGIVIDSHKVPVVLLDGIGGSVVDAEHLCVELREHFQSRVFFLVNFRGLGDEELNGLCGHF